MIKYAKDPMLTARVHHIIRVLGYKHIDVSRLVVYKSTGSKSRRVIARCHALPKIWQKILKEKPQYAIEFIAEKFDKLSRPEQDKVIIHELMHIPHSFGGGFRNHRFFVTKKAVEHEYKRYKEGHNHEAMS